MLSKKSLTTRGCACALTQLQTTQLQYRQGIKKSYNSEKPNSLFKGFVRISFINSIAVHPYMHVAGLPFPVLMWMLSLLRVLVYSWDTSVSLFALPYVRKHFLPSTQRTGCYDYECSDRESDQIHLTQTAPTCACVGSLVMVYITPVFARACHGVFAATGYRPQMQ